MPENAEGVKYIIPLEMLAELKPMDGTEATHDDMRRRLEIELVARQGDHGE